MIPAARGRASPSVPRRSLCRIPRREDDSDRRTDPDEQVRATVQLVFDKFTELGSFGKVYRYLRRNKIGVGARVQQGPRRGELAWRLISRALLGRMLHHPIYAGAYSYGRRRVDPKRTGRSGSQLVTDDGQGALPLAPTLRPGGSVLGQDVQDAGCRARELTPQPSMAGPHWGSRGELSHGHGAAVQLPHA